MTKKQVGKVAASQRSPRELGALLHDVGLRKTVPRVAVLQFMERAGRPLTHGEISEEMAVMGLDRGTVYRNLMDLVEAKLATRTDLGDHVWRFELTLEKGAHDEDHPHFLCVSCGGITCLPDDVVRLQSRRGLPRSIAARNVEVQVKGECDACATGTTG
jgi:Fur family ferric uptake transcriptional regulator